MTIILQRSVRQIKVFDSLGLMPGVHIRKGTTSRLEAEFKGLKARSTRRQRFDTTPCQICTTLINMTICQMTRFPFLLFCYFAVSSQSLLSIFMPVTRTPRVKVGIILNGTGDPGLQRFTLRHLCSPSHPPFQVQRVHRPHPKTDPPSLRANPQPPRLLTPPPPGSIRRVLHPCR